MAEVKIEPETGEKAQERARSAGALKGDCLLYPGK